MYEFSKHVGLDTHAETIAVAVADACGGEARYFGEIANRPAAVAKLVKQLSRDGEVIAFCYEAGPCGYGLYRQLTALGHECEVVAPSLIPKKPGNRVRTDPRDAQQLARLHRAGELTPVWVPGPEQEAMRDLTRAREDLKSLERQAKQRLGAYLLRHGQVYQAGQKKWTQRYFRWLERVKFELPVQQIVFQEYVDTVIDLQGRVQALEREMERALPAWSLAPVVEALMALRGIDLVSAMTLLAELGDLTRFDAPRQLMSFLGLVPSEDSSGPHKRRFGITKTGNSHARRMLVEAAWSYRFPARKTAHLQRRARQTSAAVQAIAWQAQKRLCGRYRHLTGRGKRKVQVCVAVARELAAFIWAIACEVNGRSVAMR